LLNLYSILLKKSFDPTFYKIPTMSTRAFDLQAPSRFENFKLKHRKDVPETSAPSTAPKDTLLAQMAIDTKNSVSTGNHATVDFQGDFRPIVMAMCFYSAQFYDSLDLKQHSKVSPPTLTAYFLFVIYAFYLLCDLEARSTPSMHTRFIHTPEYIDLKAFLLSLDVPDFLVKFLQAIAPCADPRRPNITYVSTFACYSEYLDFGRYFPISIFLQCHNFVINHKTNDAPEALINQMMGLDVYHNTRIGNFFGQLLSDGTNNFSYGHQLMQAFEGIINPALARSRSQRNVYSRVPHHVQDADNSVNPYFKLMNIDEDNVSETMTLMRQIQTTIKSKFTITGSLASVTASLTGMNILINGNSNYALPTWHATTVVQNATTATVVTAKTYATKLKFLAKPDRAQDTNILIPQDPTTITSLLYLVKHTTAGVYPEDDNLVLFNGRHHATPAVRVLDPYDYNATTFHNVYLSGSIIESFELDAAAVPYPNLDTVLDEENTLFLQSSLPYSDIHRATNFIYRATGSISAEARVPIGPHGQPSAIMLYDAAQNRLPSFGSHTHGAVPAALPGFNLLSVPLALWQYAYSKVGFRVPNPDSKTNNRPPLENKGKFLVWSPYRYYNGKVMTSGPENYFMITNLRTLFGTNPPLGETAHFLEVMPVS
jgi:hypothetical protein